MPVVFNFDDELVAVGKDAKGRLPFRYAKPFQPRFYAASVHFHFVMVFVVFVIRQESGCVLRRVRQAARRAGWQSVHRSCVCPLGT